MKMRRMRKNHSVAIPCQIVTIAVDTTDQTAGSDRMPIKRQFRRAACMGVRLRELKERAPLFSTMSHPQEVWEFLDQESSKHSTTWVISHDMGCVLQLIGMGMVIDSKVWAIDSPGAPRRERSATASGPQFDQGLFVVADPPVVVCLRSPRGGRVLFCCTQNWVDCDIDEMAAQLEMHRIEKTVENSAGTGQAVRLRQDAQILMGWFQKLLQWWRENDLGMWRVTAGGLAMAAFRHRFMQHEIVLHDSAEVRQIERAAYRGGETSAFFLGRVERLLHQLDVTSLFPHIMRGHHFPCRLLGHHDMGRWVKGCPPDCLLEQIAEVAVESHNRPVLVNTPDGVRSVIGRAITVLSGPELERACDQGIVVAWRRSAQYKLQPLFRSFVDELWPLRQKYLEAGDKVGSKLTKQILNTLYGKFGQFRRGLFMRPDKIAPRPWFPWREIDPVTKQGRYFVSVGETVFEEIKSDDHPYSSVAIAAYITAYARQYMQHLREVAGAGHVYYQAIDSLIVDDPGLQNLEQAGLVAENELGKLRLQTSAQGAVIDGLHCYHIGDILRNGWRAGSAQRIAENQWEQFEGERLAQYIRHSPRYGMNFSHRVRSRSAEYKQGVVSSSGWVECIKVVMWKGDMPDQDQTCLDSPCATSSIRTSIESAGSLLDPCTARTTACTD